jgi:hypothetical protein
MKQMRNISVKPNVLESLISHMPQQNDGNRYRLSYAVRQLARMGAYNEAGGLPLAIRLEATGDFTELYETCDRLICPVDSADADLLNAESMVDALVRCAVFLVRSRREEMVDFRVMVPSKAAENAPEKLADWAVPDTCIKAFTEKIETLKSAGILRENTPTDTLFSRVADKLTIQHVRRRHGYLGKESLMGLELEAVKVLEDAGINGSDLSAALANLAAHAAGKHVDKKKTGLLFDRSDAVLLIRDHQRRARIQRPGVRVIDLQFMDRTQSEPLLLPRNPGWKNVVDVSVVKRNLFESAVRWARLAALKSGRGLLPIFYFTGEEGSGRSFLLKQVAWELYKEGFAIAEIVNLQEAAKEAESLAAAAVALDAPLILVWDDAYEPGVDVLQAFREFAEAQVSGVPIMILSASSDLGYNSKKIRQISRTSFEEFEVYNLDETELRENVPAEPERSPDSQNNTENIAGDLQNQKTDEFTILVSRQETEQRETMLETVVKRHEKMSLDAYAGALNEKILSALGETRPVYDVICDLGMLGFPLPEKLAARVFDTGRIEAFKAVLEKNTALAIKKEHTPEGWLWECGHPVLVRALGRAGRNNASGTTLEKAITCMIREPEYQPWAARFMRALYSSNVLPSDVLETITQKLISAITEKTVRISPVMLSDVYQLASITENEPFQSAVVDALADYARLNTTDSFVALTPLLRNRTGGLEDAETLEILKAAKPDEDRVAFKFLLKFLSDHQPNELREASVDNARTAAARAPDQGFAVAAYLRFCWARGTDEQINRSIEETRSWLDTTPDDRVVRRAFMDYVVTKGSDELKRESIEPLEDWLENHVDEGPLRNSLIELAFALNDPAVTDRVLEDIARWIEQRGNNRSVRHNYFRRAEKRNEAEIMKRACDVAVSWLNNHGDDRETVQSLLFIAGRLGDKGFNPSVFNAIHLWLTTHVMERDLLRRYLLLADRAGKGRAITHAVETGLNWVQENPDDTEIREILLGMTARKVDRKIQVRVYDTNAQWLEALQEPDPMMEYMIGRLGVRAGIARRAIPLLERSVARSEGELRNHARLWLGSAYRVAEAYSDARNVWQAVKNDGIPEMIDRADRNLNSLDSHLKEKFPEGYPPPSEKSPPKHRPPRVPRRDTATVPDQAGQALTGPGQRDGKRRDPDYKRPAFQKEPSVQRHGKGYSQKPAAKPESTPKKVATLGDLMRMKGLDLTKLSSTKNKK